MKASKLSQLFALVFLSVLSSLAYAQNYPARSVKIIVPYPAGSGSSDAMARLIAQKLQERMGGSFYVENRPGGNATIGIGIAASADADGHTILLTNQDIVENAAVKAKISYDPFKSFVPVIEIGNAPEMIVVNPSLPVGNMAELFALLRANPGKYSYASPGYGSTPHLACEWLFKTTYGLDVVHVPFQGGSAPIAATLSGDTQILELVVPLLLPYVSDGKLRPLAVTSRVRFPQLPDVPTLEEAGVPGHEMEYWFGIFVPTGTPTQIIDLLQHQVAAIIALPDVKQRLEQVYGFHVVAGTPEDFRTHMKADWDKWRKIMNETHIEIK
jgi:tripartite-type tricarboxylate transporter receptor subunit TctC